MKPLFSLTIFIFGIAAQAEPLKLDGTYQLQSWICADGTAPFSKDIVERIVGSTFIKIEKNKLTTTFKFDLGCEVSWQGKFSLTDGTLAVSEMIPTASRACHDVTSEKEAPISFEVTTESGQLVLFHAPAVTEPCTSGSLRVYKKLLKTKKLSNRSL